MNHKYLNDIGVKNEDMPWNWNPEDKRQEFWKQQREEYGFDERETWSLDSTFEFWLYERLKMYNDINIVNTSYHKYKFKNEQITFQDCIDRMLEGLEISLTVDEFYRTEEQNKKVEDVVHIFALCFRSLWW
jgi:hypothetical protein